MSWLSGPQPLRSEQLLNDLLVHGGFHRFPLIFEGHRVLDATELALGDPLCLSSGGGLEASPG
jgi:hypothetical protein